MTPTEKLAAIKDALFPAPVKNADGSHTLHDVDENVCAAIYDLERLGADKVCIGTLTKALKRVEAVRDILASRR